MEDFDAYYVQVYDPESRSVYIRHKSTRDGAASLEEGLDMVSQLLRQYQSKYYTKTDDPRVIWLPFMFMEPKEELQGRLDDGTVRTIKQLVKNPSTNKWEGLVLLDEEVTEEGHFWFLNDKYYVRFVHESPIEEIGEEGESSSSTLGGLKPGDLPPMIPTITWAVIRREPGTVDRTPFAGKRERAPRIREYVKLANEPGHTVEIRGQWFDNLVEFSCWSTTNYSASRLLLWFERFMQLHTWILKKYGITQVLYWERMRDAVVTRWRQDLVSRTVRYYFRTEQLEALFRNDLLSVNINLAVETTGDRGVERYVADQYVSGTLTEDEYRQMFRDLSGNYLFGEVKFLQ